MDISNCKNNQFADFKIPKEYRTRLTFRNHDKRMVHLDSFDVGVKVSKWLRWAAIFLSKFTTTQECCYQYVIWFENNIILWTNSVLHCSNTNNPLFSSNGKQGKTKKITSQWSMRWGYFAKYSLLYQFEWNNNIEYIYYYGLCTSPWKILDI